MNRSKMRASQSWKIEKRRFCLFVSLLVCSVISGRPSERIVPNFWLPHFFVKIKSWMTLRSGRSKGSGRCSYKSMFKNDEKKIFYFNFFFTTRTRNGIVAFWLLSYFFFWNRILFLNLHPLWRFVHSWVHNSAACWGVLVF